MSVRLRLFPLNAVLFPGAVLNLHVFEPRYKEMIAECMRQDEGFGVVLIREGREAGDPAVEPYDVGSLAEIVEVTQLPFERYYVSTIGRSRFRILNVVTREPFMVVDAELLEDEDAGGESTVHLQEEVREKFLEYVKLLVEFSGQETQVDLPQDPRGTSYAVGDALQVSDKVKQRLLELNSTAQRLTLELGFLQRLLPQLHKLLEQRQIELERRKRRGEPDPHRPDQERYFGRYFSAN